MNSAKSNTLKSEMAILAKEHTAIDHEISRHIEEMKKHDVHKTGMMQRYEGEKLTLYRKMNNRLMELIDKRAQLEKTFQKIQLEHEAICGIEYW